MDSDSDLVYITDNDNQRIQVLDKNGNFISKWGSTSNFERPTGIAYDDLHELVYVNDKVRNNIQVFSAPSSFDPIEFSIYSNEQDNRDSDSGSEDHDDGDGKKKKPGCDPSYPDFCIKSPPPDLDCSDISKKNFKVTGSDPHGFDADNDGIGCESESATKRSHSVEDKPLNSSLNITEQEEYIDKPEKVDAFTCESDVDCADMDECQSDDCGDTQIVAESDKETEDKTSTSDSGTDDSEGTDDSGDN